MLWWVCNTGTFFNANRLKLLTHVNRGQVFQVITNGTTEQVQLKSKMSSGEKEGEKARKKEKCISRRRGQA